jgi:asparagine synthetase B (glutamine-hydrolysing)
MCGVGGVFVYHVAANKPAEAELLATRDAMRARGLDGSGAPNKGLVSRDWATAVLEAFAGANPALFDAQRLAAAQ